MSRKKSKIKGITIDSGGVIFDAETKQAIVPAALHALQCSRHLNHRDEEKIFFYSDSSELVKYITFDIAGPVHLAGIASAFDRWAITAMENYSSNSFVSRNTSASATHLD